MDNGKGAKHCSVVEAINDRFTLNEGDIACHQYSALFDQGTGIVKVIGLAIDDMRSSVHIAVFRI